MDASTAPQPVIRPRSAEPKQKMHIKDFLANVLKSEDLRQSLPRLGVAAVLSNFLAVATPMAILQIMDRIVVNRSLDTLALLVIGIVIALALEELLKLISGHVTGWLGARFEHKANVAALDHLMRVPLPIYQKSEPGAYEEKVLAANQVAEFYGGQTILTLFDLPFVVVFLGLVFAIGGWLALAPLAVLLLLTGLLVFYFGDWLQTQSEQRVVLDNRRFNFLTEVLGNMGTIKALTMESLMLRRYERLMEANAEQGAKLTRANEYNVIIGLVFAQIMTVVVVFFGVGAVLKSQISPGSLAACMMLSLRALMLVRRLLTVWLKFQHFAANQVRYDEIMSMPAETSAGKPSLPPLTHSLELRDVSLKKDGGSSLLFEHLSLAVPVGSCIAIQGESGSGKSTLLSLLGGLLKPDSGACLADGIPLQDYNADSIPEQIALLPQSSTVMSGTILENLTMFDEHLNYQALRIADQIGLDQLVVHLKLGYETPLGAGDALTAGMLQLISLVRATCRNPGVILFDEANTSLDLKGDSMVRDYLASLKGERTMVLVTHRPSLLALADKVYSIVDGTLVEGTLVSTRAALPEQANAEKVEVPPRPKHVDDLPELIRRQFDQESDLSLCLHPLLLALGWVGQPRALVEAMPHLTASMDITALCSTLHNLKYSSRRSDANLFDIVPALLPCLFVAPNQAAILVLECMPDGDLRVFDSAERCERTIARSLIEGQCYMFKKHEKKGPAVTGWIGETVWTFRKQIALAFGLTLMSTILALSTPLFVMMTYDRVLPAHDTKILYYLLGGVVIAAVLEWLVRMVRIEVLAGLAGRFEYLLGAALLQRIIHLPTSATEGTTVSKQVGRIKALESLREFPQGALAMMALELPANLILLVAIAWISPIVLAVLFITAVLYGGLIFVAKLLAERHLVMTNQLAGNRSEFLTETLAKMRTIRAAGASQKWIKRFRNHSGRAIMASFVARRVHERVSGIVAVIGTSTGLVALAASAVVAMEGKVTSGDMVAAMMICWRLVGPLQQLFASAGALARMRQNVQQVDNLMRMQGEKDGGSSIALNHRLDKVGLLTFSRVSFRYAIDADPALLGLNFTINPGASVVLAGGTGSGKSTLLKLIERIYLPQAGTISLDNIDIRQMVGADLRAHITYMPQSCDVFYGTIAQNLRIANPAATDDEMKWAVMMAGLTDDIEALPRGFETRISTTSASQMPLGFLQRLSLARTILKDAPVVLLDEPGTGLNEVGEQALTRCLEYWRGRSTVMMASHRPSHMRAADLVLFMERGSITASGTFNDIKHIVMAPPR